MNNKRFIKVVSTALTFIMLLSVMTFALGSITDNVASARVTQTQIDNLRAQRRGLERQRSEVDAQINSIAFEQKTVLLQKEILDRRITVTSLEIENTNATIEYINLLMREMEYEVFLAQTREDEQLARFRERVRNMEENGIITYLEIIFDSTSFADMLARIDFIADIMRADQDAHDDLIVAREETEGARATLEDTNIELDGEMSRLEEQEAELNEQVEEAIALILEMENDLDGARELLAQYIADEERITREINAAVAELERQQEAERQRRLREQEQARRQAAANNNAGSGNNNNNNNNAGNNAGNNNAGNNTSGNDSGNAAGSGNNNSGNASGGGGGGAVVGTGSLTWPVPARTTVSSPFGTRNGRLHGGIDIPAPTGTSVVAADSGTVLTARWSNSFGNYITISHGNGVVTLYAHLSTMSVRAGDTVSRGQHIGGVGSTGNSTAPHLHFEVRINGARVDPMTRL